MTLTTASNAPMSTPARVGLVEESAPLLPDVIRSEWTKIRSVRSTYWTLFAAAVATIGLGAILCAVKISGHARFGSGAGSHFDPASFSLSGLFLAQLAIGVLGVLLISSEYSTGMIRATFAAVPQRRLVLGAKAAVFASLMVVVGVVSCLIAFFVGQAILSGQHLQTTIGAPGVARAVIGGGLYLAVLGLLALGLGSLIRHTAGGIAALFGLILVLPGIVAALPSSWSNAISPYLPSNAGQAIFHVTPIPHTLSPWVGFGVFCAYAAVALVAASVVLTRRDA